MASGLGPSKSMTGVLGDSAWAWISKGLLITELKELNHCPRSKYGLFIGASADADSKLFNHYNKKYFAVGFGIPWADDSLFLVRTLSQGATLPLNNPFVLEAVRQLHKPVVILDTAIRFSNSADENSSVQNSWMEKAIRSLREAGCVAW